MLGPPYWVSIADFVILRQPEGATYETTQGGPTVTVALASQAVFALGQWKPEMLTVLSLGRWAPAG